MSLQQWRTTLRSLDTHDYGNWPFSIKVPILLLVLLLIIALGYAFVISPKLTEIKAAQIEQQVLLASHDEKVVQASQLASHKQQSQKLDGAVVYIRQRIPIQSQVSDLIDDIHRIGTDSGVYFKDIIVEPELTQAEFIEQPIRIEAQGNYHQFGTFISGLTSLPRLMTVNGFEVHHKNHLQNEGRDSSEAISVSPLILVLSAVSYRALAESIDGGVDEGKDLNEDNDLNNVQANNLPIIQQPILLADYDLEPDLKPDLQPGVHAYAGLTLRSPFDLNSLFDFNSNDTNNSNIALSQTTVQSDAIATDLNDQNKYLASGDTVVAAPDENRPKQPLERFDISQLLYRGVFTTPDKIRYGLIESPTGTLYRVVKGDYIGHQYGRITSIEAQKINLDEVILTQQDQYVARATVLWSSP